MFICAKPTMPGVIPAKEAEAARLPTVTEGRSTACESGDNGDAAPVTGMWFRFPTPVAYTVRISLGLAGLSGVTRELSRCTMHGPTAAAVGAQVVNTPGAYGAMVAICAELAPPLFVT